MKNDRLAVLQTEIKNEERLYFIKSTTNQTDEVLKEIRLNKSAKSADISNLAGKSRS